MGGKPKKVSTPIHHLTSVNMYLIHKKLDSSFLLDINEILAKHLFAAITVIGIQSSSHPFRVLPGRVFPATD